MMGGKYGTFFAFVKPKDTWRAEKNRDIDKAWMNAFVFLCPILSQPNHSEAKTHDKMFASESTITKPATFNLDESNRVDFTKVDFTQKLSSKEANSLIKICKAFASDLRKSSIKKRPLTPYQAFKSVNLSVLKQKYPDDNPKDVLKKLRKDFEETENNGKCGIAEDDVVDDDTIYNMTKEVPLTSFQKYTKEKEFKVQQANPDASMKQVHAHIRETWSKYSNAKKREYGIHKCHNKNDAQTFEKKNVELSVESKIPKEVDMVVQEVKQTKPKKVKVKKEQILEEEILEKEQKSEEEDSDDEEEEEEEDHFSLDDEEDSGNDSGDNSDF